MVSVLNSGLTGPGLIALAGDIGLCFSARVFTLSVSLHLANLILIGSPHPTQGI